MHDIGAIFKKEMLSLFRDKKALMTMFMPILIYPVMLLLFFGVMQLVNQDVQSREIGLAVDSSVPAAFVDLLKENKQIKIESSNTRFDFEALKGQEWKTQGAQAFLSQGTDNESLALFYHSNYENSIRLKDLVGQAYQDYQAKDQVVVLEALNLAKAFEMANPITIGDASGQGDSRVISMVIGMIAPFLVVLYGIMGTFMLSSDISAGEKERFTLETIFSVPVKRHKIVTGKLMACVAVGLISGAINLISMAPVLLAVSMSLPEIDLHLNVFMFLYLFVQLIPVMILCSALFMAMGLLAKSYQEAQSYGSMALIGLMMPCYLALIPTLEGNAMANYIPITNAMMAMKEVFMGSFSIGNTLVSMGINLGLAVIAVGAMQWLFTNDRIIFGGSQS